MHGVILRMANTGRKRKQGARKPSGDLRPEPAESPRAVALRQPHRQMAPEDSRHDQRAETPLGCLNIIGAVPNREYAAARRFAGIVGRYRAVIDAPSVSRSIAGLMEPRRGPAEPVDYDEAKAEYDAAFEALETAGNRAACAVSRMAVHGEACPAYGFQALMRGLHSLAFHFDLTDKAKSPYTVGNRS